MVQTSRLALMLSLAPSRTRFLAALAVGLLACVLAGTPSSASAAEELPDLRQEVPDQIGYWPNAGREYVDFGNYMSNIGVGNFEVSGTRASSSSANWTVQQLVEQSSGPSIARPSGINFIFSAHPTHNHWHFIDLDRFELRSLSTGQVISTSQKSGFCLAWLGSGCSPGQPSATAVSMGLRSEVNAAGSGSPTSYKDNYEPQIEGQTIDITGFAAGRYCLSHRLNVNRQFAESSYSNNEASRVIELVRPSGSSPVINMLQSFPHNAAHAGSCGVPVQPVAGPDPVGNPAPPPPPPPPSADNSAFMPELSASAAKRRVKTAIRKRFRHRPYKLRASCRGSRAFSKTCRISWRLKTRSKKRKRYRYRGKVSIYHRLSGNVTRWYYRFDVTLKKKSRCRGSRRARRKCQRRTRSSGVGGVVTSASAARKQNIYRTREYLCSISPRHARR